MKTVMINFTLTLLLLCFTVATRAQDYAIEGNEVKLSKPVEFMNGSARLKPSSDEALEIIRQFLADKTYISLLRVECHTDNSGDPQTSQALSQKRALSICSKLVRMGVDCKRLIAVGFGSTKPVAENTSPEGRSQNNRVSFINAALRGRLIGGMPADGGGIVAGEVCN